MAEHIADRFRKFAAGEAFARYDICPARLLPCEESGERALVYEEEGVFYIAGGGGQIAGQIAEGRPLVSCGRAAACDTAKCTPAKIAEWERRTGVRVAVPARLQNNG